MTTALWIAVGCLIVTSVIEWRHARRIAGARRLIFRKQPPALTAILAALAWVRPLAIGAAVWGGVVLLSVDPAVATPRDGRELSTRRRLIVALDVSPSMDLKDAGKAGQRRSARAARVMLDVLSRIDLTQTRMSVVAFYTTAKPVIIDTVDPNLIANVVDGLPLTNAFADGKTDLIAAVAESFRLAADWPARSTTYLVVSDGDSIPPTGLAARPAAIDHVLVAGVGDTRQGTFIDDHRSTQAVTALTQLAARLDGQYFNVDQALLPRDLLRSISGTIHADAPRAAYTLRELALMALAVSAALNLSLPVALALLDRATRDVHLAPGGPCIDA